MNQTVCDWLLCIGVLVTLGLAIAILVKQNKCAKNSGEPYTFRACYPCPDCKQAKKMVMTKKCQSEECRRYPNSPNCIDCKQALEVLGCQCCSQKTTEGYTGGTVPYSTFNQYVKDVSDYTNCVNTGGGPCIDPSPPMVC